jgi:cytochrome c2
MTGREQARRTGWQALLPVMPMLLAACTADSSTVDAAARVRGRLLLEQYDCGRCHVIPGVRRAAGVKGPTLAGYAHRAYIAGELPNEPATLRQWIMDPPVLVPDTQMPDLGVPEVHARDMSAYLMGLR